MEQEDGTRLNLPAAKNLPGTRPKFVPLFDHSRSTSKNAENPYNTRLFSIIGTIGTNGTIVIRNTYGLGKNGLLARV